MLLSKYGSQRASRAGSSSTRRASSGSIPHASVARAVYDRLDGVGAGQIEDVVLPVGRAPAAGAKAGGASARLFLPRGLFTEPYRGG